MKMDHQYSDFHKICDKYRKYVIKVNLKEEVYYFVSGITKNHQDLILLDEDNKILFFKEQKLILKYLKENNSGWDINEFQLWINEASNYLLSQSKEMQISNAYASIDLNRISLLFIDSDYMDALSLDSTSIGECLLFLDLIFEYAEQVNDNELKDYRESDNIDILYEFFYDFKFWKAPDEDKKKLIERIELKWNESQFKDTLSILLETFIRKIKIY